MATINYRNNFQHRRRLKNLSQKEVAIRSQKYLFSIEMSHSEDLDNRVISPQLRAKFQENGISLAENPLVSIKEQGKRWIIHDSPKYLITNNGEALDIRYVGVHELTVYRVESKKIPNPHPSTRQLLAIGLGDDVRKVFPPK